MDDPVILCIQSLDDLPDEDKAALIQYQQYRRYRAEKQRTGHRALSMKDWLARQEGTHGKAE